MGAVTLAVCVAMPVQAEIRVEIAGPMSAQDWLFGKQMQQGTELDSSDLNATDGVQREDATLLNPAGKENDQSTHRHHSQARHQNSAGHRGAELPDRLRVFRRTVYPQRRSRTNVPNRSYLFRWDVRCKRRRIGPNPNRAADTASADRRPRLRAANRTQAHRLFDRTGRWHMGRGKSRRAGTFFQSGGPASRARAVAAGH